MEKNKRRWKKRCVIPALILLFLFWLLVRQVFFTEPEREWDDDLSQSDIGYIEYEGKKYKYDANIMNILFLGIDKNDELHTLNMPGEAGQADCIMILSLNRTDKTAHILQIPRDTMTDVDIYDVNGTYRSTVFEQIATQYAYSIGGKNSCFATQKTVSELLYELPIDGYLAMDMSAVAKINDALGGVTLTIPEDYTRIDPAFVAGTTLKLTGKQAYDYVHYRDYDVDFSNNGRMQRQIDYIPALIETIRENFEADENYYETFYPLVEDYMVTDLNEEEVNRLIEYELDVENITILPGEGKKGEKYEEFYVDQEKIQKILIEMFYILKE